MAVVWTDLIAPEGPVEETLFPGEDATHATEDPKTILQVRLEEYITQAQAKTSVSDAAVEAWALHLTFSAAYMVAVARPAAENTMVQVLGSETYSKDQREALKDMAEYWASQYEYLALGSVDEDDQMPVGPPTRTSNITFEF